VDIIFKTNYMLIVKYIYTILEVHAHLSKC